MLFCKISRSTVIHVENHAQLMSAWTVYRNPFHLSLIAGFQVEAPLTDSQRRRLHPELRALLLDAA